MDEIALKLKMLLLYFGGSGRRLTLIEEWYKHVWNKRANETMCCSGFHCGCYGSSYGQMWEHMWNNRNPTNKREEFDGA
jgi:hypothetical protein